MGVVASQNSDITSNSEFNNINTHNINENTDIVHPLLSPQNLKTTASTIMTDHNSKTNESLQDITMSGTSSTNLIQEQSQGHEQRRRSTIILTEDHELEKSTHLPQDHHQEVPDQQQ
ncbi:hypothetical protein WICMUC_004762 [Wickerhamomyces mucosus]|uniref:Uncharacterized protein n=1 Tax=Wickerhamomyces mucosus TaxID=1378264 RepID=A0A9P8PF78_9ASCO|nr:hypothetical protein WICMUC_004762 [Wickerhamomyces mucosus]